MNQEIHSEKVQIEQKEFFFDLKENDRGCFLKITERKGGHRDTIMVPEEGFKQFKEMFDKVISLRKQ